MSINISHRILLQANEEGQIKNLEPYIQVDSELSDTSNNPIANSTVVAELDKKADTYSAGTNIEIVNSEISMNYPNNVLYFQEIYPVELHGSVTCIDNVLSNFSAPDGYAVILRNLNLGNSFEIQLKCTTNMSDSEIFQSIANGNTNQYLSIVIGSPDHGDWFDTNIGDGFEWKGMNWIDREVLDNTAYWLKFTYGNSRYSFLRSFDGINYTEVAYHESDTQFIPTIPVFYFGLTRSYTRPWLGTIDLSECYIKVEDNVIWSGQE